MVVNETIDNIESQYWGLKTCGLRTIWNLYKIGTPKEHEKTYKELIDKTQYDNEICGNLLFSVTEYNLNRKDSFGTWLFNHPNTKLIHHYKNNAHGPHIVFICINHFDKEGVHLPNMKNNTKKYLELHNHRFDTDSGEYLMDE